MVISHNPFLVFIILACTFSGFSIYVTRAMLCLLPHLTFASFPLHL